MQNKMFRSNSFNATNYFRYSHFQFAIKTLNSLIQHYMAIKLVIWQSFIVKKYKKKNLFTHTETKM